MPFSSQASVKCGMLQHSTLFKDMMEEEVEMMLFYRPSPKGGGERCDASWPIKKDLC